MAKEIVIDIIDGGVDVSGAVQTGDTVAVIKAKNLPEEWLSDSTYVYALISQGENQVLNLMQNATENSKTVKKCGVQSVFTADNKAFKIVIFGTNVEVGEDGTVSGSYRYVSAPVMVSVGEGLESLTAEILPDKNGYEAISSLLLSLQSAVEAEKVRDIRENGGTLDNGTVLVGRVTAEARRVGAEDLRKAAELEREKAETARDNEEAFRKSAEFERNNSEIIRGENEQTRVLNELGREDAERIRIENENARIAAEEERRSIVKTCEISDASELDDVRDVGLYKVYHNVYGASKYWLIVGYNDKATSLTFQLLIEAGGRISTRYYANNASFDDEGNPIYSEGWSDWQTIVDNSMLESRIQSFAEEVRLADSIRITLWKKNMFYLKGEFVFAALSSGNAAVMEVTAPILVRGSDTPPDALPDFNTNFKIIYTFDDDVVDQSYNANSENAQSGKAVAEAVAKIVNGSPEALDTLHELANALGNDENFSATVMEQIGKKVDKEELENASFVVAEAYVAQRACNDFNGDLIEVNKLATKEEINTIVEEIPKLTEGFEKTVNKTNIMIDGEFADDNFCYPSVKAVKDYVTTQIGDIETSLENIINKYGLGGEAL